jgi:hypothetical protein
VRIGPVGLAGIAGNGLAGALPGDPLGLGKFDTGWAGDAAGKNRLGGRFGSL